MVLLSGVIFNNSAYAASYINVSSGAGGTVSLGSIKPSATGVSASGSDTLTITTNCSAGYSVYVSAQNGGDTNLTNTNSSVTSNNTISASGVAVGSTATTLNSNTWGITGDSANASVSKYVGLPSYADATNTALISNSSASTTGDNKSTVYYGVKVDTTLSPGTYSGDVLYTTLVSDKCNNYTVHFNANGGTGTMSDQTIPVGMATALTKNTFERTGYIFLGWGTSSSDTTPAYKDGEEVTDISDFNTTINLYALWGQSTGILQEAQCSKLTAGATTYLTDSRDNQVYSIYRWPTTGTAGTDYPTNMAGSCIMTKDLSLGYVTGGSVTKGANLSLTTATSNFDSNTAETTGSSKETVTYSSTEIVTARTGTSDWSTTNSYTNKQYINGPKSGSETYSSHTYYSWGAAMVVCPKGWRLTTNAENLNIRDFMGGSNQTSSEKIRGAPYNFVYGGYFYSSGWNNVDSYGYNWSSTQYSSTNGRGLYFNSSNLNTYNYNKNLGRPVRCVAQNNYTISYSNSGADSGEASKTEETAYESGSVTMPTEGTMTKSGYEFKGWALTSGASEATYTAEESVTISALVSAASSAGQTPTPGSTITLYPVWEQSGPKDEGDLGTMQEFNCYDLGSGNTGTLTDARDGQAYGVYRIPVDQTYAGTSTVANVAGKCVMTKDLNLGAVASVSGSASTIVANDTMTLSPSDSGFTTPDGSGESITVPTSSVTVTTTYSNTNSYSNKYFETNGSGDYAGRGYYSWGAAMVSCPKGWRLPTADEYNNNSDQYEGATAGISAIVKGADAAASIANITNTPWTFVLGGFYLNSDWKEFNAIGRYWSSTQNSSTDSRSFRMELPDGLIRFDGSNKRGGFAVRCIADPYDGTMQDFDASTFSTTVGASAVLKDTRDGKLYAVKRLPDSKVWMMQNLTIGSTGAQTLTPENTNIDDGKTYYLPPAGRQGSSTIDQSSTLTSYLAVVFDGSARARTQFRTKGTSTNDSDTGYYDFYTATLGFSYSYDGKTSGSSARDICPRNWRLPHTTDAGSNVSVITTANDFTYLTRQYSTSNWYGTAAADSYYTTNSTAMKGMYKSAASPLATTTQNNYAGFSYSGNWGGASSSASDVGSSGYYWSSSVYDAGNGYRLNLGSSEIYPQGYYNKSIGYAVRCVAK